MALGKNLDNILGGYFGNNNVPLNDKKGIEIIDIIIEQIDLCPYQTRREFDKAKIESLAKSIQDSGLLSPVIIMEKMVKRDGKTSKTYTLLAGERRLRAFKHLNKDKIPAIIKKEKEVTTQKQALIAASENIHRENLNPMELANTFNMLIKTQKINEKTLAKELGNSEQYIKNYLRLRTLSEPIQDAIISGKLSEGQARQLTNLSNDEQVKMLKIILTNDLTVKEIIKLLKEKNLKKSKKKIKVIAHSLDREIIEKIDNISKQFEKAKVQMEGNKKHGKIVIKW